MYSGWIYPNSLKVEVIDLLNEYVKCDLFATLNTNISHTYGGKINDKFIYCGGLYHNDNGGTQNSFKCFEIGNDSPIVYQALPVKRESRFSAILPNNTIFAAGKVINQDNTRASCIYLGSYILQFLDGEITILNISINFLGGYDQNHIRTTETELITVDPPSATVGPISLPLCSKNQKVSNFSVQP